MTVPAPFPQLTITAIPGMPLVQPGDDLAQLILNCLNISGFTLHDGDVLVITSKIVSKAEGRRLDLRTVQPSIHAEEIAAQTNKDPRLVQAVLSEAQEITRIGNNVLITRHRLGFVSANSGIDQSNVGADGEEWVLLLPLDPDASATRLREQLCTATGAQIGIIISDTHGRPHRLGNMGVAIGVSGIPALLDLRGNPDLFGRKLQHTDIGLADEIAAAADLLSGQGAEGLPVTLIRGLKLPAIDGHARDLYRSRDIDLFR